MFGLKKKLLLGGLTLITISYTKAFTPSFLLQQRFQKPNSSLLILDGKKKKGGGGGGGGNYKKKSQQPQEKQSVKDARFDAATRQL